MCLFIKFNRATAGVLSPQPGETRIADNRQQPGFAVVTIKPAEKSKGAQVGFLHNIFCIVRVSSQPISDVVSGIHMGNDGFFKQRKLGRFIHRPVHSPFRYAIKSFFSFSDSTPEYAGIPSPPRSIFSRTVFSVTVSPLRSLLRLKIPFKDGPTFFSPVSALWHPPHCSKTSFPLGAARLPLCSGEAIRTPSKTMQAHQLPNMIQGFNEWTARRLKKFPHPIQ